MQIGFQSWLSHSYLEQHTKKFNYVIIGNYTNRKDKRNLLETEQ